MTAIQTRCCDEDRRHTHMLSLCVQALTHWLALSDIRFYPDSLKGFVVPLQPAIGARSKSSSPPVQYASGREGSVGARVSLGSDSGDADLHRFEMVHQTLHQGEGRG